MALFVLPASGFADVVEVDAGGHFGFLAEPAVCIRLRFHSVVVGPLVPFYSESASGSVPSALPAPGALLIVFEVGLGERLYRVCSCSF